MSQAKLGQVKPDQGSANYPEVLRHFAVSMPVGKVLLGGLRMSVYQVTCAW